MSEIDKLAEEIGKNYAYGVAVWTGLDHDKVMESKPVKNFVKFLKQHFKDPKKTFEKAKERHIKAIDRYKELIKKHQEKIKKLKEQIEEYKERIRKHNKAILWLDARIKSLELSNEE